MLKKIKMTLVTRDTKSLVTRDTESGQACEENEFAIYFIR